MISALPHSDYTLKNRAFNCRMRNRYYEEVYYAFRSLLPSDATVNSTGIQMTADWLDNLNNEIKNYERLINTCLEYAEASVFYGKTDFATLYSKDKRWGILQEEIFLVHFLQELHSTIHYLITRLDTDSMIDEWSESMQTMKASSTVSGYVSLIQEKLTLMTQATLDEFKDLFKHIMDRFQIGNTLFGTIQELQNFY